MSPWWLRPTAEGAAKDDNREQDKSPSTPPSPAEAPPPAAPEPTEAPVESRAAESRTESRAAESRPAETWPADPRVEEPHTGITGHGGTSEAGEPPLPWETRGDFRGQQRGQQADEPDTPELLPGVPEAVELSLETVEPLPVGYTAEDSGDEAEEDEIPGALAETAEGEGAERSDEGPARKKRSRRSRGGRRRNGRDAADASDADAADDEEEALAEEPTPITLPPPPPPPSLPARVAREGREGREGREHREGREGRESREGRGERESRGDREGRESRETRESYAFSGGEAQPSFQPVRGRDSYVFAPGDMEGFGSVGGGPFGGREIVISVPERQRTADERKIALFCDLENIALGVRDSEISKFDIDLVLERLLEKGKIIVKKAYADWERYSEYKRPFHEAAIELIDIPQKYYSGKNSADIKMVVDAMDLSYSKEHLDTFVMLSGDSDFSPLVSKLKENNKYVIGVGVKNSSSNLLIDNCDEFLYYEDVWRDAQKGPKLDGLNKKSAEVFSLMVDAIQALLRENKDVLWGSMIKQTMQRKKPSFSESYYGYTTFSELLEDAERKQIIKLKKDQRSGTYIVTGFAKR